MTDSRYSHPVTRAVSVVAQSANSKLGPGVAATYAAQSTCPDSCPLQGAGCYAELHHLGMTTRQRNRAAEGLEYLDVLRAEAAGIDALPRGGMLRVHVVGDVRDAAGAAIIGAAMARFDRRGGRSWTYTHAWRDVPRAAWGATVTVIASCESMTQAREARAAGYAAAVIVAEHTGPGTYADGELRVTPCVEQTRGRTCRECGLCTRREWLESGNVIAFAAHGMKKAQVKRLIRGEA